MVAIAKFVAKREQGRSDPLTDQTGRYADLCRGFGERGIGSQKEATVQCGHRYVERIESLERDVESREPLGCQREVWAVECQPGVDSLLQMRLKHGVEAMRVRPAHFAGTHLPPQGRDQLYLDEPANREPGLFLQGCLCLGAQRLRTVIGCENAGVNVGQYKVATRDQGKISCSY